MSIPTPQRIQMRFGTSQQWLANPVLAKGEPGYDLDTKDFKIGDGVTQWLGLPLANAPVFRGLFVPGRSYLAGQYVEGADGFAYVSRRNMGNASAQPVSGPNWRKTSWGTVTTGPAPSSQQQLNEWSPQVYDAPVGSVIVVLFDFTMYQLVAPTPFDSFDFADELDFGQWMPICCENTGSSSDYLQTEDGRRLQLESGETIDV